MPEDNEIIGQWSQSAPYWEKHRAIIREMFAPVTQALIEAAQITTGQAVLDVATGPGEPALSIAEFLGPDGQVVGTDIVAEMVEAARREAGRRNLLHATFVQTATDRLPFRSDRFDAAVSRFGAMFFPAPVHALREILRVLKPGAPIAIAVWHFANKNPFHYVISQVVDRYVPPTPPVSDAPDAFRFANPGELLALLTEAGATAASERLFQFPIHASISAQEFWTLRSEMSDKLRTKLATLSPTQLANLQNEVLAAIQTYATPASSASPAGITFPAEVLILTAQKPHP